MTESTITIVCNLTEDPSLRFTPVSVGFGITEGPFAANPRVAVPCGASLDAWADEPEGGSALG